METLVAGLYDPTLGTRVMVDSTLMSTFLDFFTPLEMLMVSPRLRILAQVEILGQPLPDEPTTSSHRIDDEIRQRLSWLNGRLSWGETTCTQAYFPLREWDTNIHELRKKVVDVGVLIKGYKCTETTLRCDMDALKKAHYSKVERLKKKCNVHLSRLTQFEKYILTSHVNMTEMQKRAKATEK